MSDVVSNGELANQQRDPSLIQGPLSSDKIVERVEGLLESDETEELENSMTRCRYAEVSRSKVIVTSMISKTSPLGLDRARQELETDDDQEQEYTNPRLEAMKAHGPETSEVVLIVKIPDSPERTHSWFRVTTYQDEWIEVNLHEAQTDDPESSGGELSDETQALRDTQELFGIVEGSGPAEIIGRIEQFYAGQFSENFDLEDSPPAGMIMYL